MVPEGRRGSHSGEHDSGYNLVTILIRLLSDPYLHSHCRTKLPPVLSGRRGVALPGRG